MSLLSCTNNAVSQLLRQSKTQRTFVFVDMKRVFWGNLLFCEKKRSQFWKSLLGGCFFPTVSCLFLSHSALQSRTIPPGCSACVLTSGTEPLRGAPLWDSMTSKGWLVSEGASHPWFQYLLGVVFILK